MVGQIDTIAYAEQGGNYFQDQLLNRFYGTFRPSQLSFETGKGFKKLKTEMIRAQDVIRYSLVQIRTVRSGHHLHLFNLYQI